MIPLLHYDNVCFPAQTISIGRQTIRFIVSLDSAYCCPYCCLSREMYVCTVIPGSDILTLSAMPSRSFCSSRTQTGMSAMVSGFDFAIRSPDLVLRYKTINGRQQQWLIQLNSGNQIVQLLLSVKLGRYFVADLFTSLRQGSRVHAVFPKRRNEG